MNRHYQQGWLEQIPYGGFDPYGQQMQQMPGHVSGTVVRVGQGAGHPSPGYGLPDESMTTTHVLIAVVAFGLGLLIGRVL